ncbi:cold-shock protein [Flammeovirga kamogawensis]|uniref:Cold shock domain-containing protein n=1 Tax=Flammeovirga kamogawensis TaxID=373891 RepID=A0ABX8GVH3_9BACT|nr:cold shock domain-containing protein [Flammeovirga kamogawensis]MBB6459796.1 cold shock CspA family protein [Flammeovirga kamogawensis]QWG07147.1 cold shock domain-containing protein [Flammeovirga kamogawensis]TRX68969.1 cold shock domain-containing protein [Flammeovirga kamogawensis]
MARSQQSFNKKEKEKKRQKKKEEKAKRKEERKENSPGGGLDSMMAYVDEFGNITDTPPDPDVEREEIDASTIEIAIPKMEDIEVDPVHRGRVEFFNDQKGFGFIKDLDTQEKFFVHVNGLVDQIEEGDKVTFELEKGMKGMNCVNVKRK